MRTPVPSVPLLPVLPMRPLPLPVFARALAMLIAFASAFASAFAIAIVCVLVPTTAVGAQDARTVPAADTMRRGASAAAIVLRGVVQGAAGDAIPGALVELRDSESRVLARQLASERGGFAFPLDAWELAAPGRPYRLDVRRIGYVRLVTAPFRVTSDTTIALTLAPVVTKLPAVTARELDRCSSGAARGSATSRLWESAATSLLSASATVSDSTYVFDLMPTVRTYTLPEVYLTDVRVRDERVRDAQPWSSLDPAELAEFGYVRLVGRALEYVAPDVDVLTSAQFLTTHCLQVREDRLAEGLIGLAFAPTGRVEQADIRGVLWIDRESLALRTIHYTYSSLPLAVADSFAGGRVDLAPLPAGGWIPSQWSVRSPVPEAAFVNALAYRGEDLFKAGLPVAVRQLDPPLRARRLQVTGSAVQRVRRVKDGDSVLVWQRDPSGVQVTAEWEQNGVLMPASRATISLGGSSRSARADLLGRVTFSELPPGDYFVEAITDEERLLRLPPKRQAVTVEDGARGKVRLGVLSPLSAIARACGASARGSVLAGTVTQHGRPVAGAAVSLWRFADDDYALYEDRLLIDTRTDEAGRYVVCGVPRGVPVSMAVTTARGAFTMRDARIPTSREAPDEFVTRRDVSLPVPRIAR